MFLAAFAVYAWTASSAMGWLDSPEFVAASASMGIPHSPGHPLPVQLGTLASLIPVGDITVRVHLASSLAGAAACAVVQVVARGFSTALAPGLPRAVHQAMAAALALVLAFSAASFGQATRAEVYALQTLLFAATALCVVAMLHDQSERPGRRAVLAGALIAGLALATHHLIALTFLLPGVVVAFAVVIRTRRGGQDATTERQERRPWGRLLAMAAVLGVLGLAVLAYLPVRAARHPEVNWGAPSDAGRFLWTVSARAFHKSTGAEHVSSPAEDAAQIIAMLIEQLTWPLMIAALLGVYFGLRRLGLRRLGLRRRAHPAGYLTLFLIGVVILGCAARVLVGFDPETPDHQSYLVPALIASGVLSVGALAVVAEILGGAVRGTQGGRRVAAVMAVMLAGLVLFQWARTAPTIATADASDRLAAWELDRLRPRTLLLTGYFQTRFRLMARRAVDHARPDVVILDRSFLTYPGAAAEARRRFPDLANLIDAPLAAGAPTPVERLARLARTRPIAVQLHINLEPEVDPWLLPTGPFARFVAVPPSPAMRSWSETQDHQSRTRLLTRTVASEQGDAAGLRDALLWNDFMRLRFYCRLGRRAAAQVVADAMAAVIAEDVTLQQLARECELRLLR